MHAYSALYLARPFISIFFIFFSEQCDLGLTFRVLCDAARNLFLNALCLWLLRRASFLSLLPYSHSCTTHMHAGLGHRASLRMRSLIKTFVKQMVLGLGSITLGDISCRPRPLVTIIPPPYCWLCRFFIITAARMDKKDTRWFPLNLVSLGVRYVMIITGASLWGHPPVIADQRVCVRGEIDCLLWFFGPPFEAVLTSISSTGACALE